MTRRARPDDRLNPPSSPPPSNCASSQSINATRSAFIRILVGLVGLPCTTRRSRPLSRAQAARHRTTASWGIAPRSIRVPMSASSRSVALSQPGRCGQPSVSRCSSRSVSATRRQSAADSGRPPSMYSITTRPSAKSRPSVVGIGTGTASPARSRCSSRSASHSRSASFRCPSRATASLPPTRTLQTSLDVPPVSRLMRTASSPHRLSASQAKAALLATAARSEKRSRV